MDWYKWHGALILRCTWEALTDSICPWPLLAPSHQPTPRKYSFYLECSRNQEPKGPRLYQSLGRKERLIVGGVCVGGVLGAMSVTERHPTMPNEAWGCSSMRCGLSSSVYIVPSGDIGVEWEKERGEIGEGCPLLESVWRSKNYLCNSLCPSVCIVGHSNMLMITHIWKLWGYLN